jgi:anti-anti-sigma factor
MEVFQEQCESISELTGALDINTVDEVRKILLAHLEQNTSIVVDLSSVASCDAAGAQLLLALEKSAESAGKPFVVLATSEGFARDCANLGITITPSTVQSAAKNSTILVEGGIR